MQNQQIPALTPIVQQFVGLLQAIGYGLIAVVVAIIALIVMTSFGNSQRRELAIGAGVCLIIGLALLATSFYWGATLQRLFPITPPVVPPVKR